MISAVRADLIDFDLAVNLTRAVGQTMARLADWEVSTLVSRVDELAADPATDEGRTGSALRLIEQIKDPFEDLLDLRLAPPPRRRRGPGRGAAGQRGGPQHRPAHGRLRRHRQLHRALQPAHRGADRRPGRALRVPLRRRRHRPGRPGHQEHRRLGAVRQRGPDPAPTTSPRGSSTSSAATPGCPTSGSAWPAARS